MTHRKTGAVCRVLLALVLAPLCALCAAAAPLTGTLTLHCHYGSGAGAVPLAGDTYALVAVADAAVDEDGSLLYTTRPEFAAWDCDWAGLTASQRHDAALQLQDAVLQLQDAVQDALPESTPTGTTDANGDLTLRGLEPALYLVLRTSAAPGNVRYRMDPLLVSVPLPQDGCLTYEVTITPKFAGEGPAETPAPPAATPSPAPGASPAPTAAPTPAPQPTAAPGPALPQTGQLNWPIPLLLVAGAALFMLGLALRRKQEPPHHEA